MITVEHVETYSRYGGSIDGYYLHNATEDTELMEAWGEITSLLLDAHLVNKGLASESFRQQYETQLKKMCDSDSTIQLLRSLAKSI